MGDDAVVVFFDDLKLQRSEEFLIDQGHRESVISTRNMYQQAIEATFRAAVERIIGRRVVSFASTHETRSELRGGDLQVGAK
jgi:uncharacterized protein YbcI